MRMLFFVLPWAAIGVALAITAAGAVMGTNVFKKQGVAWLMTIVMVIAAVGIGYAKAPASNLPAPDHGDSYHWEGGQYFWDNAKVLSDKTFKAVNERNERLWWKYNVSIGVVTCNYGGDDLYDYALQCAEDMGLGGYDMIVVLDISGDNYWLRQGNDIRRDFTNDDCSDYAYDYMEKDFAKGDYDQAVLKLTQALEAWYGTYYR